MPDWSKSMQQRFEFYTVDPTSWENEELIENVETASVSRDLNADTLGSASVDIANFVGEKYIREYLVTIQNGLEEKFVLGTHLLQSPSYSFDGMNYKATIDAYTPLMELKEQYPPFGYTIRKGVNIPQETLSLINGVCRAPVSDIYARYTNPDAEIELRENFVANPDDTWFTFLNKFIKKAMYSLTLDERGVISLAPLQTLDNLTPMWTFDDGNSSILYQDVTVDKDIFGIPNVIEIYKGAKVSIRKNTDSSSPVSIQNRGREIVYREVNPNIAGGMKEQQALDEYAETTLKRMSTAQYSIDFKHGYCPVRIGDCVMLNYAKAGLNNVRARIISQTIDCKPGCTVTSKAVYTEKLFKER